VNRLFLCLQCLREEREGTNLPEHGLRYLLPWERYVQDGD
jgi:hypothetical protein